MKRSHRSSMILILLSLVACTSLAKDSVLQTVGLTEADHFLEGAGFNLTKDKNGCLLAGVGYSESGKRNYVFHFNKNGIKTAHYIESRYAVPIYINSNAEIVTTEKVLYRENSEENEVFEDLFSDLKALITHDNLKRCG